jgi:hypothetical protein
MYVRLTEFNPEGLAASPGSPNRVHGRVTNFSRFEVLGEETPENGGMGGGGWNLSLRGAPIYHPPTETWNFYAHSDDSQPRADITHAQFSNAALLDLVSNPTAIGSVETGKTTTFEVMASGDLGEPIASQDIAWALQRESTLEEVLDTSGAGPTVTLVNTPLDGQITEIRYLGTLLTESVDYDPIVLSSGLLTWTAAGAHDPPNTSGYTATYTHRGTVVGPPHGALLADLSRTNVNGKAITRVQYDDDADLETMVENLDGSPV